MRGGLGAPRSVGVVGSEVAGPPEVIMVKFVGVKGGRLSCFSIPKEALPLTLIK